LIGKPDAGRIAETLIDLHRYLAQRGLRTLVEKDCAPLVPGAAVETGSFVDIGGQCDLFFQILRAKLNWSSGCRS
jgi:hypothetical protein